MLSLLKNRWSWLCLAILVAGLGIWCWLDRHYLLGWYHVHQLSRAPEEERGQYLDRLVEVELQAVPLLLDRLQSTDETTCANCGWALAELARRWAGDPARRDYLLGALADHFASLSSSGRVQAVAVLDAIVTSGCKGTLPKRLADMTGQLMERAMREEELRPAVLNLAAHLFHHAHSPPTELLRRARTLAAGGLNDRRPESRAEAIRLAAASGINMLDKVGPFVTDPSPEVRRLALVAVGDREDVVATDDLLPLLHDPDAEVRAICEQALASRGIRGAHLNLARMMADPQPSVRAKVPGQLPDFHDLDARVWLERLSRDNSPAVRASVIRAAAESNQEQLRDCFSELRISDPCPTVRQIAEYYRTRPARND